NQSLGGYVSASIGLGNEVGIGASIGTNGASVFGGVGGFNASIGTSGVGIGYGTSAKNKGDVSLGVSLNYNYSSGLSGGISFNQNSGKFGKTGITKYSGVGI